MKWIMRWAKRSLAIFLFLFLLPAGLSYVMWQSDGQRPSSWRNADWGSSGLLADEKQHDAAIIHVMAARTGSWKGAFSVHSWIVMKAKGEKRFHRYDVVGWGKPVRRDAYPADGNWYSNKPEILLTIEGERAEIIYPKIMRVIESYPHANNGDYVLWPGPNSNSFISYILNQVPEMGMALPANAIGRDYTNKVLVIDPDWGNLQLSLGGYLGFSMGKRHGLELNILGLVAGLDFHAWGIKVPGFGTLELF